LLWCKSGRKGKKVAKIRKKKPGIYKNLAKTSLIDRVRKMDGTSRGKGRRGKGGCEI